MGNRLGTQFNEDGMADMHSHMDDAAEHQVPEGCLPQNPQGMGLDRLGTQFDEDGMGDMHVFQTIQMTVVSYLKPYFY